MLVWIGWRVFAPQCPAGFTFQWSAVICFALSRIAVFLWPNIAFEFGQRIMRLYRLRKDWLVMRDLPVASKRAWRRVRAEARRRKAV